jgi:AraC-like DNA-binding protein
VYFTEIGFAHFATHPANELFNLSLSLNEIFSSSSIAQVEEKLLAAQTDKHRIKTVEQFLLSHLKDIETDKLIVEAVKLIYQSKGTIRIKELNEKLFISQSPFEKRFRKLVGTSAKKFANIVRFNTVLDNISATKTLTDICYENNFFDQAHFIKDFKKFTGNTPENFKRFL